MNDTYRPEGFLIDTAVNREILSDLSAMENAMARGTILEGMAMLCDEYLNLHVNMGEYEGIMEREEVMYCRGEEKLKDIAILTRVGKPVCFKIIGFEQRKNRTVVKLSRREAQYECYSNYLMSLIPGDIIPARVTHLENFGAFVDIGCGISSLLSVDCISVSRISHPKDRLECGMDIMAVIKSIDTMSGKIYITHRELLGTWEENAVCFCSGQTVAGIIRSIEQYGIFVELAPNLAGLAELRDSKDFQSSVEPGQWAAVYIKNIIPERMKIKLVLIDTHKGKIYPSRPEYFIDTSVVHHINSWRYSPESSDRIIETVF